MVSSVLFYYPEYVHSDAGVGVYLHWSDLLQEVAMLYPLQCLSFVLYIEGTKNEIVDEHPRSEPNVTDLQRTQNAERCRHDSATSRYQTETLQRILVSMERFIGLFSSFATCGSIGLSDYRCVKGSPFLGRGARQYFSSKLSIRIIYVAVTKKPGTD